MKIIIELEEELYNYMQTEEYDEHLDKRFDYQIRYAIINGTPLPKGHGRLIDEQQIIDTFKPVEEFEYWRIGLDGLINVLSDAPTIIEADRGE